jgi:hypothetical protein
MGPAVVASPLRNTRTEEGVVLNPKGDGPQRIKLKK